MPVGLANLGTHQTPLTAGSASTRRTIVSMAKKARGWEKSLDTEVMLAAQKARTYPKVRLAICCSATCEMFHELETKLRAQIDNVADVVYSGVSADLLVHTGPDLVGICVQGL